jgi:hypothetical protein
MLMWWDLGEEDETGDFGVLHIGHVLQLVWVWGGWVWRDEAGNVLALATVGEC